MKIVFILLLIYINCNFWDNIYTNYNSKYISIRQHAMIDFYTNNSAKAIQPLTIYYSTNFNSVKIVFKSNPPTYVKQYVIIIDFNKGFVYLEKEDGTCIKTKDDSFTFDLRYLIRLYDIITYLNPNPQNPEYEFYITNDSLLEPVIKYIINILRDTEGNQLNNKRILNNENGKEDSHSEAKKNANFVFYVTKKSELLQMMDLKLKIDFIENLYESLIPNYIKHDDSIEDYKIEDINKCIIIEVN